MPAELLYKIDNRSDKNTLRVSRSGKFLKQNKFLTKTSDDNKLMDLDTIGSLRVEAFFNVNIPQGVRTVKVVRDIPSIRKSSGVWSTCEQAVRHISSAQKEMQKDIDGYVKLIDRIKRSGLKDSKAQNDIKGYDKKIHECLGSISRYLPGYRRST